MIFNCISTVEYKILVNGSVAGRVDPIRGLKQGDHLSPYLFIMCAAVLFRMIAKDSGIQGISVSRGTSVVTHILYVDDILLES